MNRTLVLTLLLFGCQQDIGIGDKTDPDTDADVTTEETDGVDIVVDSDVTDSDGELSAPLLVLDPRFVDFGNHPEGTRVEETVTFRNEGDADLNVTGLELVGSPAFDLPVATDLVVAPGASSTVTVGYTAATGVETGDLVFNSNDPGLLSGSVGLEGSGLAGSLSLPALDFGHVMINTMATEQWEITNTGDAPVEVTAVSSTEPAFQPVLQAPITIDPGTSGTVRVNFRPTQAVPYAGELNVTSNANPATAPVQVTGIGADKPVALCHADPPVVSAIHQEFSWVGSASFDPAGRAITNAQWTLVSAPSGSAYTITGQGLDRNRQVADVVGDYVAELVVTNDLGVDSDPCTATLTAEADADLWVEMFWRDREDIDLHLIRGNGRINTGQDCYYANCIGGVGRPWGLPGIQDNAFLDLDDTVGRGPENINIAEPESTTYRVVVLDYVDNPLQLFAQNRVTVKIYIAGQVALDRTVTVVGEGDRVNIADIDWTTSPPTVTPL